MFGTSLSRLRARLAVIIAAALAPAGVLAVVQALNGVDRVAEQQTRLLEVQALGAIDTERALLLDVRQTLRTAANETERRMDEACHAHFKQLKTDYHWLLNASLFDRNGTTICSTGDPIEVGDLAGWQAFVAHPRYTLSAVRTGQQTGKRILLGYFPITSSDDTAVAIGFSIDVTQFQAIASLAEDRLDVALLDRDGEIITANDEDDETWLPEDRLPLQVFGDRRIELADASGVQRTYFVSSMVGGQLWAVVNNRPQPIWASLTSFAGLSILAPIAIWLIAVLVAYFAIDNLVTRHIASLRQAAVRIGEGDLSTPIGDYRDAPAEVNALGVSIRRMRDKIADREAELTETLELQKRLLLEIHHRVKNNLQTISSLMNLESARISSRDTQDAIEAIQSRIHSLAMVHQNLYAAENLEEVALDQLTRDIASHLEASLSPTGETSISSMELEPLVAPTILATPISLFLSEALGNAFKHAASPADIRLSLKRVGEHFVLSVSNRIDAAKQEDDDGPSGLGLELMSGFAKQVGGALTSGALENDRYEVTLSAPADRTNTLFSVRKA